MRRAILILLVLGLPGCSGPGGESSDAGTAPGVEITDPTDFANASLPGSHVHNYWRGGDRVTVFDDLVDLVFVTGSCPFGLADLPANPNCVELTPVDDAIVPPGTQQVDITVDLGTAAQGPPAEARLYYEAPSATADGGFETGTVRAAPGSAAVVNVTAATEDLPHTTQTRWRFWASMSLGTPGAPYTATFRIEAVRRPGELTPAPPHPDHWQNATSLLLRDYDGPFNEVAGQPQGGHPGFDLSPTLAIVPPEAKTVTVAVWINTTSPPQTATKPLLVWRGADRRDAEDPGMQPTTTASSGSQLHWEWAIAVEPRMWDSPYAKTSAWHLVMDWHGGTLPFAGPTYTQGDAVIRITTDR